MAFPVLVFWSSRTRLPGSSSPSITYSAFAMQFSLIVRHGASSTAWPRIAPAMDSSLKPKGVVGGSKQAAISMAGSTPMLIEIGKGLPSASAFSLMAPRWRAPGVKNMEISSLLCRHRRWMVTSDSPVSTSCA